MKVINLGTKRAGLSGDIDQQTYKSLNGGVTCLVPKFEASTNPASSYQNHFINGIGGDDWKRIKDRLESIMYYGQIEIIETESEDRLVGNPNDVMIFHGKWQGVRVVQARKAIDIGKYGCPMCKKKQFRSRTIEPLYEHLKTVHKAEIENLVRQSTVYATVVSNTPGGAGEVRFFLYAPYETVKSPTANFSFPATDPLIIRIDGKNYGLPSLPAVYSTAEITVGIFTRGLGGTYEACGRTFSTQKEAQDYKIREQAAGRCKDEIIDPGDASKYLTKASCEAAGMIWDGTKCTTAKEPAKFASMAMWGVGLVALVALGAWALMPHKKKAAIEAKMNPRKRKGKRKRSIEEIYNGSGTDITEFFKYASYEGKYSPKQISAYLKKIGRKDWTTKEVSSFLKDWRAMCKRDNK